MEGYKHAVSMIKRIRTAETMPVVVLLTISGGLQDAYSYMIRDHVFANAQTGNIVLMTMHLFDGDLNGGLRYMIPILSFATGVFVAEQIHVRFKFGGILHWRQFIVLLEVGLLFIVGFIPYAFNDLANAMVSFSCAMQVQTFRKFRGYGYASTMCIGNMRSGMEALSNFFVTTDKVSLKKSLHYFGVITVFAMGAGLGRLLYRSHGVELIWVSSCLLFIAFCIMFIEIDFIDKKID